MVTLNEHIQSVSEHKKRTEEHLHALREIEELIKTIQNAQAQINRLSKEHNIDVVFPDTANSEISLDAIDSWSSSDDELLDEEEWESSDAWVPSNEEDSV